MEKRRTYEFDTLKEILDSTESSAPQYFISIKWFKEWKNFIDGVNKGTMPGEASCLVVNNNCIKKQAAHDLFFHLIDPPGPINNFKIGYQRKRGMLTMESGIGTKLKH